MSCNRWRAGKVASFSPPPRSPAIRFLRMLSICTGLNEPRTSGRALRNRARAASSWRRACCPAAYPSAQTEARQAAPTASAPQAAHAKRLPCSLERWPPLGGRWNEGMRGGRHGAGSGMAATQSARSREGSVSPSRATCPPKGISWPSTETGSLKASAKRADAPFPRKASP